MPEIGRTFVRSLHGIVARFILRRRHLEYEFRSLPIRLKRVYEPKDQGRQWELGVPTWWTEHRCSVSLPSSLESDVRKGAFSVRRYQLSPYFISYRSIRKSQKSRFEIVQAESRWWDEQRVSSNPSGGGIFVSGHQEQSRSPKWIRWNAQVRKSGYILETRCQMNLSRNKSMSLTNKFATYTSECQSTISVRAWGDYYPHTVMSNFRTTS